MKLRIDLKIIPFAILFILTKQIYIYSLIMIFAFFHEIAHLIVGLILKFKVHSIEIMPLGFCITMQPEIYDTKLFKMIDIKKIIISSAGPALNLFLIIIFLKLNNQILAYSNLIILILNILPIYPLDGGRILKSFIRIISNKDNSDKIINFISNLTIIIITVCASIIILYLKNISIILMLIYLWNLVIIENKRYELKKRIKENL